MIEGSDMSNWTNYRVRKTRARHLAMAAEEIRGENSQPGLKKRAGELDCPVAK